MLNTKQKAFFKSNAMNDVKQIKNSIVNIVLTSDKDVIDEQLQGIIDSARWLIGWAEFNLKVNSKGETK